MNPYIYKNIIWTDLETRSRLKLRKVGAYRYSEECDILLWSWALNDENAQVWDVINNPEMPVGLMESFMIADTIGWHNGNAFDRNVILRSKYAKVISGKKFLDTMVQAYQHSLPGGLGLLCDIFSLPEDEAKKKTGKALVRLFCQPLMASTQKKLSKKFGKKIEFATKETHPKEWAEFIDYCKYDIPSMRKLHKIIPKWNLTPFEAEIQNFDLAMNDRGINIDVDFCERAIEILDREKVARDGRTSELTDGEVSAASRRDKLLKYLCGIYGLDLPDMRKSTLERRLLDENLPDVVKELINLRLESAATNTKKYGVFRDIACADGRIRGTIQHRGAFRTGRAAARLVQPQNMARPKLKWPDIEEGIEAVKGGYYDMCRWG